jgi:tRNA threonylcarbamoyladenosine biosynthesis protein TsaB
MNEPLILLIETSTELCSVAISKGDSILKYRSEIGNKAHAKSLAPIVESLLNDLGISIKDLSAIAISEGPGSYTGLRVGVSFAKGICYASNIPLISISSLESVAQNAINLASKNDISYQYIIPMIDARRMEVYSCIYNKKMEVTHPIEAKIIDDSSFSDILKDNKVLFCGNCTKKVESVINNKNAHFIDTQANALGMLKCALIKYNLNQFEDTAYFEPFYLKDFIPGISKKGII